MAWFEAGSYRRLTIHDADRFGQMLIAENVAAVRRRYPNDSDETLPGRIDRWWTQPYHYEPREGRSPAQGLDAISSFEYQCSVDEEFETSRARTFCTALRERLSKMEQTDWHETLGNLRKRALEEGRDLADVAELHTLRQAARILEGRGYGDRELADAIDELEAA